MIEVGQIYSIKSSGSEGSIMSIGKSNDLVTVHWTKFNNHQHDEMFVYTLQHVKQLIADGTMKIYSDLPAEDPNSQFNRRV